MKKVTINAIIDIGCLVTFIPALPSGLVLFLVLPSGTGFRSGEGLLRQHDFLSVTRGEWLSIHNYISLLFAALLIIHLLLHLNYFKNIKGCFSKKEKNECVIERE